MGDNRREIILQRRMSVVQTVSNEANLQSRTNESTSTCSQQWKRLEDGFDPIFFDNGNCDGERRENISGADIPLLCSIRPDQCNYKGKDRGSPRRSLPPSSYRRKTYNRAKLTNFASLINICLDCSSILRRDLNSLAKFWSLLRRSKLRVA